MDWAFRADLSAALRQLPSDRFVLEVSGHRRRTDHVETDSVKDSERVLGQALEPGISPAGSRPDLPSPSQAHGRGRGRVACVCRVWADSRPRNFAARPRRIWSAYRIFRPARPGCDVGTLHTGQAAWAAERSDRLGLLADCDRRSSVLAFSSAIRVACHTSLHAGDSRSMTQTLAERCFDLILWLAGAGHFVILIASAQVPSRLRWKQDLAQLMPFNRKLLWVQGGFTVLTIIAFGTLTLVLHRELLRGDRAAVGLACFIGLYWTTRIVVDFFYFSHTDWPKGTLFVVGHSLLTLLFIALAASYLSLFMWHVWLAAHS